jgi:CRP/FNR family transcriptional regulator, cyclic AMP receptor protein
VSILRGKTGVKELFENCSTCRLRSASFFCQLDEKAVQDFDRITFTNVYPREFVFYTEGSDPRGVFLVCSGSVKLSISSGEGRTLITRIVHGGDVLGLSGVIAGHPYKSTATALEPCQVKFARRDDFLRWMETHADACRRASLQLAHECEISGDHIRSLGLSQSASEKLARLILSWAVESGKETADGIRVPVLLTQQDISELIGTSRETVTRLLRDLKERQILSVKGAAITIHDRPSLQRLVLD